MCTSCASLTERVSRLNSSVDQQRAELAEARAECERLRESVRRESEKAGRAEGLLLAEQEARRATDREVSAQKQRLTEVGKAGEQRAAALQRELQVGGREGGLACCHESCCLPSCMGD